MRIMNAEESCSCCAPEGALLGGRRTFWESVSWSPAKLALAGNLVLAILCWAAAFPVIKVALRDYSAFNLAGFRFLITAVALAGFALVARIRMPALADMPRIFLAGLTGVAGYHMALNFGQKTVTAGAASFITSTTPVITAIFACFLLRERLRWLTVAGLGLSLTGTALIAVAENKSFGLNTGALAVLGAALFQSLYFIVQKPLLKKYTALEVVSYSVWAGCLGFLLFTPGIARDLSGASLQGNLCVVFLALFPGLIGFVCWSRIMSQMPASKAVSFLYLNPIIASLISWVWLSEIPSHFTFAGGLLALGGVVLVNSGKR